MQPSYTCALTIGVCWEAEHKRCVYTCVYVMLLFQSACRSQCLIFVVLLFYTLFTFGLCSPQFIHLFLSPILFCMNWHTQHCFRLMSTFYHFFVHSDWYCFALLPPLPSLPALLAPQTKQAIRSIHIAHIISVDHH